MSRSRCRAVALGLLAAGLVCGCGSPPQAGRSAAIPIALLREARPIGVGARFRPPARGPVIGRCRPRLGPRSDVHVELFAQNRVVLVPAGIGTRPPRVSAGGRITAADCYGDIVTLDPTGVVLVRAGLRLSIADLFRSWGQPVSDREIASFTAARGARVAVYVDGRAWRGAPADVPLSPHAEIVLEVGPHVPPHAAYTFPSDGS